MNNRNSLIWLFIYLYNIYQKNLVESVHTSDNSSLRSVVDNSSHGLSSYQSTGDLDTVVDSNEFGTGSSTLVLPEDPNQPGSSFSSSCIRPNLSGTRPISSDGSNTGSSVTSEASNPESSDSNELILIDSGSSPSVPSPRSDFKSLYDNPTLCKMIRNLSSYELIDLVDLVTQKVKSLDANYNIETDLSSFVERTYTGNRPIVLNIADLVSTDEFACEIYDDKVVYTPEQGYGFKLVRKNNTVLWHTNIIKEYATKLECDNTKHTVTIHKPDQTTEEINFTPDSQDTTDLTIPESDQGSSVMRPTVLNINRVSNCDEYKYKVSNGIITCIANDKYGFKLVRQNKTVLWHTINPVNYSKRVDCDSKNNRVTIYKMDQTRDTTDFLPEQRDTSNLITIDIDNRWSTQFYTYERSGDLDVFVAIKPYLVRRIVNKGMPLWWQRDNMYPCEIEVSDKKDGKRNLVIYFKSKSIEFFDPDDISADETSHGSGLFKQPEVKFFKANPNDSENPVELDASDYTSHTEGNVCSYLINVNCVKFMYGNEILWLYDSSENNGKYPKSLYHDSTTDTLVLNFVDFSIIHEEDDDRWVVTIVDTSGVKLFVADPNDNTKDVEIDISQLNVIQRGDVTSYHIPEGTNCKLFKYNGSLLWALTSYNPGKYPKSIDHYTKNNVLVLRFEGLDMTFEYGKGGWVFTETGPLALKLYEIDPNDSNNSVELPRDQITVNTNGDITTFTIANGVNCVKLIYGQILLWEHDPNKHGGIYPKSLYYDKSNEMLVLKFDGLDITFAKNFEGDWIFSESGPSLVKLYVLDPNDASKYVKLASDQFSVTTIGDVTTFNIVNGVNCALLKYVSFFLWQHHTSYYSGIYPKSLEYIKTTETLVLKFEGLDLTFHKTTDGWESTESGPLAIKLYVVDPNDATKNIKLTRDQVSVTESGDITTFNIPKGVNCNLFKYGTVALWAQHTSYHSGIHPMSVVYDKSKETLVLKFEGLNLTFYKTNDAWESTESGPLALKFYAIDPSDSNRKVLIDSSQLTLIQDRDDFAYSFENGVKCVLIMYNFRKVWKKGDQNIDEPSGVSYNMKSDQVKVCDVTKSACYIKNDDGTWSHFTINNGSQVSPPSYEYSQSSELNSIDCTFI